MAMHAQTNELLLVYFGYTGCPDICPTTMADVGRAIRGLPTDLGRRVDVAMVTLDPERDTPDRLAQFLAYFFVRSHGLRTTDAHQLADAAAAFEVRWEVEPHQAGEPYKLSHTAVTYAVDDTGTVLVEWPFGTNFELIKSDLAILLER
jgi:protein SCO1/2